ncbi:hypothetical protein AAE02nite_02060 [Adhaeribacter aerolatus]|uniref:Uncharacterized protein n=1 Tax=Adhaeribacter aerolatus TaxID=670289 RepID=A0A512AS63_9BACT|nr:hypothetical protein [Adhaeribacter aerolatus]GEO02542.1 hypothetical protein AAE02nite_02060 [Adhaeribacter aerolatus]
MRIIFVLVLIISFAHNSKSQTLDFSTWKQDSLPTGKRLSYANLSSNNWIFVKKGNKVIIEENNFKSDKGDELPFTKEFIAKNLEEIEGNRFVKEVEKGFLIGLNHGEFGGGLLFVSNDGLTSYKIGEFLRIKDIFEWNSRIYAIEGLAHLGSSNGQIIEIFKENGSWKYKTLSKLIEAPALIAKANNQQIIITSQYILRLTANLEIEEILKAPFYWGVLYPSSIHIENKTLYLAMRQGVLEIENFETTPKYRWYIKK